MTSVLATSPQVTPLLARRSVITGILAGGVLIVVYLAIISLAQGLAHALDQLATDAGFIAAVTTGLGIQVALFVELRSVNRNHRLGAAMTAAGTGTSAAAMLACCAHHVVDLLPLVGLSAAAVFLNDFKVPLLLVGIATNVLGIVVIARALGRARRACAIAALASA